MLAEGLGSEPFDRPQLPVATIWLELQTDVAHHAPLRVQGASLACTRVNPWSRTMAKLGKLRNARSYAGHRVGGRIDRTRAEDSTRASLNPGSPSEGCHDGGARRQAHECRLAPGRQDGDGGLDKNHAPVCDDAGYERRYPWLDRDMHDHRPTRPHTPLPSSDAVKIVLLCPPERSKPSVPRVCSTIETEC